MKNLKTFSSVLAMLICLVTMAQDQTVFGVVSDASGPLPGVTVIIQGKNIQTQSNKNGHYKIRAKKGDCLLFTKDNYLNKFVKVANIKQVDVNLSKFRNESGVEPIKLIMKLSNDSIKNKELF
jgi:Ca-activated chloride channel family protein